MATPPILDDHLSQKNSPHPEEVRILRQIRIGRIVLFVLAGIFGLVFMEIMFDRRSSFEDGIKMAYTGTLAGLCAIITTAFATLGWLTIRWPIPAFGIGIVAFFYCYLRFFSGAHLPLVAHLVPMAVISFFLFRGLLGGLKLRSIRQNG
jgi:hypothetical protein